jgi:hypothetical protein
MLRLALILALVAALAALGVSQLVVAKKVAGITEERNSFEQQSIAANQDASKSKSDAKKATEAQKVAEKERDDFKGQFEVASSDVKIQRKRAEEAETKLNTETASKNDAQEKLAAWNVLGIPIDQVKQLRVDLTKTREERDIHVAEKVVMNRKITELDNELKRYSGGTKVPLPAGLKGKVVTVDANYDFVVLDIGSDKGALTNGEMLVSRDGKLVAKLRLVRVQNSQSIANILPEWKQVDVVAGDLVLPAL